MKDLCKILILTVFFILFSGTFVSAAEELPISANGGFLYDGSGVKCRTNIFSSHMAYWSNGKRFAKNIVQTYNDGYKYFYAK